MAFTAAVLRLTTFELERSNSAMPVSLPVSVFRSTIELLVPASRMPARRFEVTRLSSISSRVARDAWIPAPSWRETRFASTRQPLAPVIEIPWP